MKRKPGLDMKTVPVRVQELFRLGTREPGITDRITGEMGWRGHGLSRCRGSQAILTISIPTDTLFAAAVYGSKPEAGDPRRVFLE